MWYGKWRHRLNSAAVAVTLFIAGWPGTSACCSGQVAGAAPVAAFPTNEQLRHFRRVGAPRLSPDGRSVLVAISDSTADGGKSHVWLIDVGGGEPRQLTFSPESAKGGERAAEWMPDGQSILFLAQRGEHTSLYRLPMGGGEAKPFDLKVLPAVDTSKASDALPPKPPEGAAATEAGSPAGSKAKDIDAGKPEPIAVDVSGYSIAPDGKHIAMLIQDPQTPGEKRQKDAKADAEWVDHDAHGSRLYLLDPVTEKLTLTAVPIDVRSCSWSADSSRLVALADAPNGLGELHPAMSVWLLPASDLDHPQQLRDLPPTVQEIQWSRDGERLLYLAQARQDAPPGVSDLYSYSLAQKISTDMSEGFAGTLEHEGLIAQRDGEIDQLAAMGVEVMLARYLAGQPQPRMLRLPVAAMQSAGTNAKESGWIFTGSDGAHATALYFAESLGEAPRPLKLPPLAPDNLKQVAPRRVHWKSGHLSIEALLYLPETATSAQKVPLVVEVHGGPTGVFSDRFDPFAQFLVGEGWAVLRPNPRGSTGYGTAFAAANKNDLGGGDYRDIMAGVDFVLKTEPVDATRLALIGYSYGGEMAGFVEGKTDRFKAIVSAAPVIDQFSEYGTEKGSWYDRWFYGLPWEHHEDAWRQSPLAGVSHAKTPFLLLQGESDTTDPLGQSQEMYRALRQAGVPVSLVTYPREDHGPLAIGIYGAPSPEPWHGFDARRRIVAFIDAAFRGQPLAK